MRFASGPRVAITAIVVLVAFGSFVLWRVSAGRARAIAFWSLPLANTVRITQHEFESWGREQRRVADILASYQPPRQPVSLPSPALRAASQWLVEAGDARFIALMHPDSTVTVVACGAASRECAGTGARLPMADARRWLDQAGFASFESRDGPGTRILLGADPRVLLFPRVIRWSLGPPGGHSLYLRPTPDSVETVISAPGGAVVRWLPREMLGPVERFAIDSTGSISGSATDGTRLLAHAAPTSITEWRILRSLPERLVMEGVGRTVVAETLLTALLVASLFTLVLWTRRGVARERAERAATEARLEALRGQLQPHFLFNALNTIAEFVHEDPTRAEAMLVQLGELLHLSLSEADPPVVTLARELELLEAYLAIERLRFGEALVVQTDVDDVLRDAGVPSWLLQPVVENAIKFGAHAASGALRIRLVVRTDRGHLAIAVHDPGDRRGDAREGRPSHGRGLANVRARLHMLYGDDASLRIEADGSASDGGTVVTISLPIHFTDAAVGAGVSG